MNIELAHVPFLYEAHKRVIDIIRDHDDVAIKKAIKDPQSEFTLPLCTCGEDVAGFGVPYQNNITPHRLGCRFRLAVIEEYKRIASGPLYVNVYLHDRAFGGPEEGGWWYDTYEVRAVYPVEDLENANALVGRLENGPYTNEGRREIGSVISEGVWEVRIEQTPGENRPKERPYYE